MGVSKLSAKGFLKVNYSFSCHQVAMRKHCRSQGNEPSLLYIRASFFQLKQLNLHFSPGLA